MDSTDSMSKKFSQWSEKLLWIRLKASIIWYEPFKVSHATYIIRGIQEIYTYLNGVKIAQGSAVFYDQLPLKVNES